VHEERVKEQKNRAHIS